jgi:cytochrome c oxidase cbb3-type subunit 3
MSGFWSVWVMILACVTVGISLALFLWALWMRIPTAADGTTGHVWAHGALREQSARCHVVDCDLRWHLLVCRWLSGDVPVRRQSRQLEWTSQGQMQSRAAADAAKLEAAAPLRTLPVEQLAADKDAVGIGHRLYLDNCAACHGREAANHAVGAPDLTDTDWLWGGDAEAILTSILGDRGGVVPPLAGTSIWRDERSRGLCS